MAVPAAQGFRASVVDDAGRLPGRVRLEGHGRESEEWEDSSGGERRRVSRSEGIMHDVVVSFSAIYTLTLLVIRIIMVSYTLVWHHRWLQLKMIWGRPLLTAHQAVSANALGVFYHITACEVTTLKVHGRGIQPTSFALLLTSMMIIMKATPNCIPDIDTPGCKTDVISLYIWT